MISSALKYARANSGLTFRPDANCVLWLPGQDDAYSATIRDRSGKVNNGTITGATWTKNSKGLWYLLFAGGDDLIGCGAGASLNFGTGDFTLLVWINTGTAATQILTQKSNVLHSAIVAGYGLYLRTTDPYIKAWCSDGTTVVSNSTCATNPADGAWHLVGGVWVSATDTISLYLDGVFVDSDVAGAAMGSINTANNLEFGRDYNSNTPRYYYTGSMGAAMYHKRALTTAEILSTYQQQRHRYGV